MPHGQTPDEQVLREGQLDADPAVRRNAFERLFVEYQQRVAVWCLRFTGDREASADLAQDVFLKAYGSLGDFKGTSRFSTWLYSITRNHCLNYVRSAAKRTRDEAEELSENLVDELSPDPVRTLQLENEFRLARQIMTEELSKTEIQVMTLRYTEELPVKAITRILRLENQSGAKAYLVSAKRKLGRALARHKSRKPKTNGPIVPGHLH